MKFDIKKNKHVVFPIVALLISLGISLLLAEAILRIFHLAPPLVSQYGGNVPDPYLPYKPKPLSVSSGRSLSNEYDYESRHNSFGFRDIEHSFEKDEDTFRIIGLGDSFTYGAGVKFEETYLYQLEKMLNNRPGFHPRVEIIKAGISRYFPEPERILLEKYGKDYSPDLILVGFLPNDVIDTYLGIDAVLVDKSGYLKTREAKEIGRIGMLLYKNSHLLRLILKHYIAYQVFKKYRPHYRDVYKANGFHEKDWQVIEHEYYKIASIARSIESQIVFVHIPQKGPWDKRHFYPSKRLAKWARDNDTGFIDILPSMIQASENKSLYYEEDGHCTPDGYSVIARVIYKYLTENRLIP